MFGRKKKPKTVYQKVLQNVFETEDGKMEYEHITGEKIVEKSDTTKLDIAILEYFGREAWAMEHLEQFFQKNTALSAIPSFENWLYSFDRMDQPMLGLAILLMRDSELPEAVKFGIYLTRFTDLEQNAMVKEMVIKLGKHPAFAYYAMDALLQFPLGTSDFYEIGQETQGYGKKIYEKLAKDLMEKRIQWN